ncbi:MAG TPA: response regulator [Kofleriaceae bacterium]
MTRILTVDDSSTIRTIITKQLAELGYEIEQAEDGFDGLAKLQQVTVDLILLDVTMPNLDGPGMLASLRERGDHTPVIMLTSESKRSVVAGAVKLGISDYILKPFKPDELRAKVQKVLGETAAAAPSSATERTPVDVLVVDDIENVHKKLRALIPPGVSMNACTTPREAHQLCHDHVYRMLVIDLVIPDVNSVTLMNQLRALQPQAQMIALALRGTNDLATELKSQGFHDVIYKPFEGGAIGDLVARHFDQSDVVSIDGNVMSCAGFDGKDDRVEKYFTKLRTGCRESLEKLASACYDESILDLGGVSARNGDKLIRFVIDTEKEARRLGLQLRLVGKAEQRVVMSSIMETAALPFFTSVADAHAAESAA